VQEIVAPSMEGDRFVVHTLYSPKSGSGDLRGRAAMTAWPDLLVTKIATNWPDFDLDEALDDSYRPLTSATPQSTLDHRLEAVG
jgi:hypothetical protein